VRGKEGISDADTGRSGFDNVVIVGNSIDGNDIIVLFFVYNIRNKKKTKNNLKSIH
jgi:hypothetical protein